MRLTDVEQGSWVRLISVDEKGKTAQRLAQYGLFPGDLARLIRRAPLKGPLLIEANGRELALGRQFADKIMVEPV
jgi:ferrous iron transport protein A